MTEIEWIMKMFREYIKLERRLKEERDGKR